MQMELTLSAAGSRDRANLGPVPGSAEAVQMTVISGRRCYELLKLSGQTGSLARMSEALFQWKWASSVAFLTWKPSAATPSRRLLFQLAPSTPRTEGIESGLWQTPNANEDRAECYTLETSYRHAQEGRQIHLAQEVRDSRLWPTPRAADGEKGTRTPEGHQKERERRGNGVDLPTAAKMWPTPTGQDASNNGGPSQHERNSLPLNAAVMWPTPTVVTDTGGAALCKWGGSGARKKLKKMVSPKELNGALNPTWVCWLMGYPLDWLDGLESPKASRESRRASKTVSINSGHSEIASSRKSPKSLAAPSSRRRGSK